MRFQELIRGQFLGSNMLKLRPCLGINDHVFNKISWHIWLPDIRSEPTFYLLEDVRQYEKPVTKNT